MQQSQSNRTNQHQAPDGSNLDTTLFEQGAPGGTNQSQPNQDSGSIMETLRRSRNLGALLLGLGTLVPGLDAGAESVPNQPENVQTITLDELRGLLPPRPVDVRISLENVAEVEQLILRSLDPYRSSWSRQEAERQLEVLNPGGQRLIEIARAAQSNLDPAAPQWQREALDTFIRTRTLGIEFPERLPREHLQEIIRNRENIAPDGRDLAVVIMCKGDYNGAFYISSNVYEELIASGHRVLYYEATSDTEVAQFLNQATGLGTASEQRAAVLVFGGHGSRTLIKLQRHNESLPNMRGYIDFSDEEFFRSSGMARALADGGQIVLDSCSNGQGGAQMDNVANFLRRVFPHAMPRGIWSATASYGPIELHFNAQGDLERVQYPVPEYRAYEVN